MDSIKKTAIERMQELTDQAKERLDADSQVQKPHLSRIKDEKAFFIADIFDTVTYRNDIASMEYPLFALQAGDRKLRLYEYQGLKITIAPNVYGMATIHDKDILIYCISKMYQAIYEGEEIHRTIRFTIYDYLKSTNRGTSGRDYERTKDALNRLKGTSISIESENKQERIFHTFGLLDDARAIEEKDGRMIRVEVTISKWLYQSVQNKKVLSISPDYFRLRKPLDRRIYELARKHCGHQEVFKISLDLLRKKSGTTTILRDFRKAIRSLAASDDLPDYAVQYDDKKDMVIFYNRDINIQINSNKHKTKQTIKRLLKNM